MTAARALVTTLGCKEVLYLVHGGPSGEHHGVVPGPEHVTAGGYDHLFSSQHRSYDGVFGKPYRGQRTSGDPAPFRNPELYHLCPAFQEGDGHDLPPPYEPEDCAGGQQPGRDGDVHPQGFGERGELAPADARDGQTGPELPSVHRGQQVRPVVTGDGHEGVRPVHPLLKQKVLRNALVV